MSLTVALPLADCSKIHAGGVEMPTITKVVSTTIYRNYQYCPSSNDLEQAA
jgi:hypothetical protein